MPTSSLSNSNPTISAEWAPRESFLTTFRQMLRARTLEDKLASLYRAGGRIVGGVYLGRGQEAFSAGLSAQLSKGRDIYAGLLRDQAGRMAFGEDILDTTRTYLGSVLGPMKGRDGNIHRGRPAEGMPAMISHLGSMISVISGMLLARKLSGNLNGSVGATSIGEGGTSTGAFHEGLNMAAVEKLPLIISVANNQFAYSTPTHRQFACKTLLDRAAGYGVDGYEIDGTNLDECINTFAIAVQRARAGFGPQMIVGNLLRLGGHGEHDDAFYIPAELKKTALGQDCLLLAESKILSRQWLSLEKVKEWKEEVTAEIEKAFAQASSEPTPDAYTETWSALSTHSLMDEYYQA